MKRNVSQTVQNSQLQKGNNIINRSFSYCLERIAREYGHSNNQEWSINIQSIDLSDKKLLLSHILDSEDYEWCCYSAIRTESMFRENLEYIEDHLSDVCEQVYHSYMTEMGLVCDRYQDNGEIYYRSNC